MNDMRKWMNLSEDDEWIEDGEVAEVYIQLRFQEDWFQGLDTIPDSRQLFTAQDMFQQYIRPELEPAWITDMKIGDDEETYFWKISRGEDDPDE